MSRYFQVYKFTREDGVHDGRWLSAAGDGAMRWVSTRGDAHKLTRKEAEALATYVTRVYSGALVLVVGDAQSPLEALAKPSTAKRARANPAPRARRKASARKAASSGARSPRPAARRAGGPRFRYLCLYRVPGARAPSRVNFNAGSDEAASAYCSGLLRSRLPQGAAPYRLTRVGPASSSARAKGSKKKALSNPAPTAAELARAERAFERFTGHPATTIEEHFLPRSSGAAWALGPVPEIRYIATRNGETVEYVHKFRARSRPLLTASSDGKSLYLLGGAYSITDRGIVDDA